MATIAFLGLGNMGGPMAKNLIAAGHSLTVFDLVEAACAALQAEGASVAASAAEAAANAEVIISMLPAGKHVATTFLGEAGLLANIPTETLILDASTIDAATAREVGEAAAALGIDFMGGGSAGAFERARPILEGMGSAEKIFHAGPAGAGQVAKAANNMLLAIHMIGTCEALAMGEAHGLDPAVLSEIMKASSGNNWSLQVYNPWPDVMPGVPSSNDYKPGFMVDLMVKDLGLACEVAESAGVANQLGKQAMAAYVAHQGDGNGPSDFSSILNWVKRQ
jgi:3-hydroxyisobutyrate dehydrogenase